MSRLSHESPQKPGTDKPTVWKDTQFERLPRRMDVDEAQDEAEKEDRA